ncbi:MAG: DUF349 domain-containing protein [Cytophagaceae bacterium]
MINELMDKEPKPGTEEKENLHLAEDHHEEEIQQVDYSSYSKEQLLEALEKADFKNNSLLRELKSQFDNISAAERDDALQAFIENGGEEADFDFKKDNTSKNFEKLFDQLKEKQKLNNSNQEKEKENNLKIKNALLEKLRELIALEETTTSITSLKDLQEEWKKTGPVPQAQSQTLWNNYNALVERFYNNRSIYFELKELDRKKNLETKKELCEKAEKLADVQHLPSALKELKQLHEEYKHIGPVPKEDQEALWARFKAASDKIYEKRANFHENQKKQQEENYKKKLAIAAQIEPYTAFESDRIDDWKAKTAEVLKLQTEWKAAGMVTEAQTKELSKKFWPHCKKFFHNKDQFFKKLEARKEENLKLKTELCEKAEALKESQDFNTTARELKSLQKRWEEIGPVPIKQKEAIFKRFKEACDFFFSKKREQVAGEEKQYETNLTLKQALIEKIEQLAGSEEEPDPEAKALKGIQVEWAAIGFVPKAEVKNVQDRYSKAIDKYLERVEKMGGENKEKLKLSLQVEALKNSPDAHKKLHKKESDIHKKISSLKHDIHTWTTNMDFLGRSAAATKLKAEMQEKINLAEKELKGLQDQMKIIKSL